MRKLLDFLFREKHWFLFILLEFISLALVFRSTKYQRTIILSSANIVTGSILSASGQVTSYLNLRDINKELMERNGQLEKQISVLKEQLNDLSVSDSRLEGFAGDSAAIHQFDFVQAMVVSNSVTRLANYITINKGSKDGIQPDMGVVSERGVVGIVSNVSDQYAVIISLLNPKMRLSGMIKGSNSFGPLSWDGRHTQYVNLDEIPRHIEFQLGDSIITSGYSSIFPPGIMIGTISEFQRDHDDNFYSLRVKLSTDFHTLNNVLVIKNNNQAEQLSVEQEARRNDP